MRYSILCFASSILLACGGGGSGTDTDAGPGGGDGGGTVDSAIPIDAEPACAGFPCPPDQHCEVTGGAPTCVDNTCEDLNCSATEECVTPPTGGAYCEDISCNDDIDCPADQYCNGTICVDDVCTETATHCDGGDLYACTANGDEDVLEYSCGGGGVFTSECVDDGMGNAACTCEDDWDCPANTNCEGRVCVGTGDPPQCLLPPEPFANALPVSEFEWGGDAGNLNATGSPFEGSSQVVQTVSVANLDDDNNDGIIDDRDIPEIIFISFCGSFQNNDGEYTRNGVLRAVHGGGPSKGQDFFADCAGVHWAEGDSLPVNCTCDSADLDSTASVSVGDLNYDGVPEIVAVTEGSGGNNGAVRIYSNLGVAIATGPQVDFRGANPAVSIGNLDNTATPRSWSVGTRSASMTT